MKSKIYSLIFILSLILLQACGDGAGNPGSEGTSKTWSIITADIQPGADDSESQIAAQGRSVDIIQNPDCDGNPDTLDAEPFTEHTAKVTITLKSSNTSVPAAEHIIEGYRIDYTTEIPGAPPIQSFLSGSQTVVLKPETETSFNVVLVDIPRKLKLYDDLLTGQYEPQYPYLTYTAVYTFYGKDIYGSKFTTVVQTNFDAGNYNYCPQ